MSGREYLAELERQVAALEREIIFNDDMTDNFPSDDELFRKDMEER